MEVKKKSKRYSFIAILGSVFLHLGLAYAFLSVNIRASTQAHQTQIIQMSILQEKQKEVKKEPLVQKEIKKLSPPPIKPKKTKKKPKKIKKKIVKKKVIKKPVIKPIPKRFYPKQEEPSLQQKIVQPKKESVSQVQTTQKVQQDIKINADVLSAYLSEVRRQIQNNLQYPYRAKRLGLEGRTIVSFLINKNGDIDQKSLKILQSSGNRILDKSALASILEAAPFGKTPQKSLRINIPVIFRLKG